MLNFALAYGIRTWSHWNLAICFVLSFAANVLVAGFLALIGLVFAKKAKRARARRRSPPRSRRPRVCSRTPNPTPDRPCE